MKRHFEGFISDIHIIVTDKYILITQGISDEEIYVIRSYLIDQQG